jgi:hypothetical protein
MSVRFAITRLVRRTRLGWSLAALALLPAATLAAGLALPSAAGEPPAVAGPTRQAAVAAVVQELVPADAESSRSALVIAGERLATPEAAFVFVRDQVALQSYPGALRGPPSTLVGLAGNPLDRARLLSELLRGQGLTTRLARGPADEALVARLMQRITHEPAKTGSSDSALLASVQSRAAASYAGLRAAAADSLAESLDLTSMREPVQRELADHWWLEFERDGEWVSADPSLADNELGTSLAMAESRFDEVPEDRFQTMRMRVVAELETAGVLSRQVSIDHVAPAEEFTRQVLALGVAQDGLGNSLVKVLGQTVGLQSFRPVLRVGNQQITGDSVQLAAGDSGDDGGLLADLDFGAADEASATVSPTLVGLVLEIEFAAPDAETWQVRRLLLDRLTAEDRFSWERADHPEGTRVTPLPEDRPLLAEALQAQHLLHAYDGAHDARDWLQTAQGMSDELLVAARDGAALDSPNPSSDPEAMLSVFWRSLPITSDLAAVPAVNDLDGLRFFPERPRLVMVSSYVPAGTEGMAVSVDLLQDRLRAVPAEAVSALAVAERRLWFGALQGSLEAEFSQLPLLFAVPEAKLTASGAAYLKDLRLASGETTAAAGIARRLAGDAAHWAVVGQGDAASFWDIEPKTGETRAVSEPGLGFAGTKAVVRALAGYGQYGNGIVRISEAELQAILTGARRLPGRAVVRSTANEYRMLLSISIENSVPASLIVSTVFSVSMIFAMQAVNDLRHGQDWTDRF